MIEIVTLFLGLVNGPQPVELAVRQGAAVQVEVRLDGQVVKRLKSPPWRLEVDLGEALAPHELVAVAYDESGRELARARRWINIDLPRAQIDGQAPPGGLTVLPVVFAADRIPSPDEMGAWFLATAFSQYLAGLIAKLTGVTENGEGEQVVPPPIETVNVYGDVFQQIALVAIGSAAVLFILAPLLNRWTHAGVDAQGQPLDPEEA